MQIWNECHGIDWAALEVMAEIHGVSDVEILVAELMAIRGFMEGQDD